MWVDFELNYQLFSFVMRDAEASRSKTCLLLKNKKQNTFASKYNLESTKESEGDQRGTGVKERESD